MSISHIASQIKHIPCCNPERYQSRPARTIVQMIDRVQNDTTEFPYGGELAASDIFFSPGVASALVNIWYQPVEGRERLISHMYFQVVELHLLVKDG